MEARDEVERIATVYRDYAEGGVADGRWSRANPGNRAIAADRERALGALLARHAPPLARADVLEVGCGEGDVLGALVRLGAVPARLHGVDLLPDAIEGARSRHADVELRVANAEALPYPAAAFDLVLVFTVFTSILDDGMARRVAAEIDRVLRPGGGVVWYDFRYDNPANPHVRGVGRRRIAELFPGYVAHCRSLTVLPPLARRLGRATAWAYPLLARIAPLRTHYLALLRKPG